MKSLFIISSLLLLIFSSARASAVESAPYKLLKSDEINSIQVRHYESMVLVSAPMSGGSSNRAFRKLFK